MDEPIVKELPASIHAIFARATSCGAAFVVPPQLGTVEIAECGDQRLEPPVVATMAIDNAALVLKIPAAQEPSPLDEIGMRTPRLPLLKGRSGTHTLEVHDSIVTQRGIVSWQWTLVPGQEPSVWFGRIIGGPDLLLGENVALAETFVGRAGLYFPDIAGCDVALIEMYASPLGHVLVLDTRGRGIPAREFVQRILAMLQFFLGLRVSVEAFRSGSADGQPSSEYFGSAYGRFDRDPLLAYWPLAVPEPAWIVPAMCRLAPRILGTYAGMHAQGVSAYDQSTPPILRLALEYYLTSFRPPWDEVCIKLTVALEGTAMRVLFDATKSAGIVDIRGSEFCVPMVRPVVAQSIAREAWYDYVETNRGGLRQECGRTTHSLPPTWRVRAAFAALDLPFTEEMTAVTKSKVWNQVRHEGIVYGSPEEIAQRVAVLRMMLVAIVLRWCGYHGPVIGHLQDQRDLWLPADATWWGDPTMSDDAIVASRTRYLVRPLSGT